MAFDGTVAVAWSAFSLLFVGIGLAVMYAGWKKYARSKAIAATETTAVRDLRPGAGTVEVTGTARPVEDGEVRSAPMSGADALSYHVAVERRSDDSWKTVHERGDSVPFVVEDGTGEVRVEVPPEATPNLEGSSVRVRPGEDPPAGIRQFLRNDPDVDAPNEHEIAGLTLGQTRRYTEGVLEPGETAYVLGEAVETDAGWGETAVVITGDAHPERFLLSDKSEDELAGENKVASVLLLAFGGIFATMGAAFAVIPWLA